MADPTPEPPTTPLVAIATGLALVTYLESALIEYPLHGLGPVGTVASLVLLLAAQVLLAVLLYRRVRRSEDAYSVFFRRATLVALATFVALTAVLLVPHGVALVSHELGSAAALPALPVLGARA
ncbi:MAG: hypothetical protein P8Y02_01730 [Deinococcales bacterium]